MSELVNCILVSTREAPEYQPRRRFAGVLGWCLALLLATGVFCEPSSAADDWITLRQVSDSLADKRNLDSAAVIGLECLHAMAQVKVDDTTRAAVLAEVARHNMNLRNLSLSDSLYSLALELYEPLLPDTDPTMLSLFRYHSFVLFVAVEYARAEAMLKRSLDGWEQTDGRDTTYAARMLLRIGVICMNQGRMDDAEVAMEKAFGLLKAASNPELRVMQYLQNNLANLYRYQKRFDEVEESLLSLITVLETSDGVGVSQLSTAYHNLADLYGDLERFEEAETCFAKTIQLETAENGPDSYSVAMALTSLGNLLMLEGKVDRAGEAYKKALRIKKALAGTTDRSVANTLVMYSQCEREKGNSERALQLAAESFEIRRADFVNNSWIMAEENAITFSQVMRGSANAFFAAFGDQTGWDTSYVHTAANIILSTKGLVTDCMFDRRQSLSVTEDSSLAELMDIYESTAKAISGLYFKGPGSTNPDEYRRRVDSLMRESQAMEGKLAILGADVQTSRALHGVAAEKVQTLLPDDAVLIEYIEFDAPRPGDTVIPRNYFALVLSSGTDPAVINLGSAGRIDSVVLEYRRNYDAVSESWPEVTEAQIEQGRTIHEMLYSQLIAPIEEHLHDKGLVLIAPDGALNLVSFGGLHNASGDYLIERYALHYLAAGRDLVRLQGGPPSGSGLLAFGGIDFDSEMEITELAGPGEDLGALRSATAGGSEVTLYAGPTVRAGLDPLPYTRREVSRVAKIWESTRHEPTLVVTGAEASEELFKQLAPGKRVIHCATHGFFGGQQLIDASGKGSGADDDSDQDNPLVKSGLFFAGVVGALDAPTDNASDDGFLTALEVGNMNLLGVEWVVLSACGSGLGEVQRGEGVYGLRRAFILAGARTVISALWSIPDKRSQMMMEQLYESGEVSLAYAMRRMAVKEITNLRSRGLPTHPFNWGAFVAVGDWTSH